MPLPNMSLGHHMKMRGWPRSHKETCVYSSLFIVANRFGSLSGATCWRKGSQFSKTGLARPVSTVMSVEVSLNTHFRKSVGVIHPG